jgi:RNA polymerase sigma-70 factor (ECF subfamily)
VNSPQDADDATLLARIAQGDRVAMRALYDREAPAVRRYARSHGAGASEVEDVVQDVMLEVWRLPERYAGRSSLRAWLLGIARNKTIDKQRARWREIGIDEPDELGVPDSSADPEAAAAAALDADRVRACLAKLKPAHRTAIHLAFFEGLDYADIAVVEDAPVGTIKTRIMHAKRLLMHCLERTKKSSGYSIGNAKPRQPS